MEYEIKPNLQKILDKLRRKDNVAFEAILDKIKEIVNSDPDSYKPLKHIQNVKRVHIIKSFVLVFSFDKRNQFLSFLDYDHHDNVYKKFR